MKKTLIVAAFFAGVLSLAGRTWTSSDGAKELEGEFKSFDAEKGKVAIEVAGQEVKFDLGKLSQADQDFVKKQGAAAKEVDIAALLKGAKIHRLQEGKFSESKFEAEPDSYLFYFSASW